MTKGILSLRIFLIFNFNKPRVAMGMNVGMYTCMCILTLLSDTRKVFTAVLIFGAGIVNDHIDVFYPPL